MIILGLFEEVSSTGLHNIFSGGKDVKIAHGGHLAACETVVVVAATAESDFELTASIIISTATEHHREGGGFELLAGTFDVKFAKRNHVFTFGIVLRGTGVEFDLLSFEELGACVQNVKLAHGDTLLSKHRIHVLLVAAIESKTHLQP